MISLTVNVLVGSIIPKSFNKQSTEYVASATDEGAPIELNKVVTYEGQYKLNEEMILITCE